LDQVFKRTWAKIDVDALEGNYRAIRSFVNNKSKIMCVVKADAYGHGAEFLAAEYQKWGADWLAVSNLEEAVQIRKDGTLLPILVLGYTPTNMVKKLCKSTITQTVMSMDYAVELSRYACKCGTEINVHVKLDTGMNRIGMVYQGFDGEEKVIEDIEKICNLKGLRVEGIFTHFAAADEGINGNVYTKWQFENFNRAINILRKRGIKFPIKHCSNSGGILAHREMNMDMVRAGIILYGLLPSKNCDKVIKLRHAMQLKTVISQVKEVKPFVPVSYGRTFYTDKITKIATVPIGYADGYPRRLSGRAQMIVCGKRVPIIGMICMDQIMLDISDVPCAKPKSIVTVFGRDGNEKITLDELANLNQTINYELACIIGKRVPRVFFRGKKRVGQLNYICPQRI
jgi:alanine racemase